MANELGLFVQNNKVLVGSRIVAENFGKRHGNVIQKIETLISQSERARLIFKSSTYEDKNQRERLEYIMDHQGYTILVMGFTGKKALEYGLKYTDAFEKMKKKLLEEQYRIKTTPAELLLQQAEFLVEQERKTKELEQNQERLENKIIGLTTKKDGYYSPYYIAEELHFFSANSDRPHADAVHALAKDMGIFVEPNGNIGYSDPNVLIAAGNAMNVGGRLVYDIRYSKEALSKMIDYIIRHGIDIQPPYIPTRGKNKGKFIRGAVRFRSTRTKNFFMNYDTYKAYYDGDFGKPKYNAA